MEEPILIKVFFASGFVLSLVLWCIKQGAKEKVVSPVGEDTNRLFDFMLKWFESRGYDFIEWEPLDGKGIIAHIPHPKPWRFWFFGILLLFAGFFPGLVWFLYRKNRLSISLKQQKGFGMIIVETNSRHAQWAWQRFNLILTRRTLGTTLDDVDPTIPFP